MIVALEEAKKKLLELRGGVGVGLVFKGVMMLDWQKFVYQSGPYVLGENSYRIAEHDRNVRTDAWRIYSANWMRYGHYVTRMQRFINENKTSQVNMCLAGTFDGGIYFPHAVCAQIFRSADEGYDETMRRVVNRNCVKFSD